MLPILANIKPFLISKYFIFGNFIDFFKKIFSVCPNSLINVESMLHHFRFININHNNLSFSCPGIIAVADLTNRNSCADSDNKV